MKRTSRQSPIANQMDVERSKKRRLQQNLRLGLGFTTAAAIVVLVGIADLEEPIAGFILPLVCGFVGLIGIEIGVVNSFQRQLKHRLLTVIANTVGELRVLDKETVRHWAEMAQSAHALPGGSVNPFDGFDGTYRDLDFAFIECRVYDEGKKRNSTKFRGLVLALKVPKPFTGTTALRRTSGGIGGAIGAWWHDLQGFERVSVTESGGFGEAFEVRSTAPAEAGNCLRPACKAC